MRKSALFLLVLFVFSVLYPQLNLKAIAGNLTSTYLRLTRQATSTASGGLVCATTPTFDNGTEASVQVIFPSGFTLNTTASNWTVDTTDIPAGSTAWPGIDTAISVSNQTVTFPSSNLATNTQYCFTFSSSGTLTTPSTSGSYAGSVRTRTGANAVIDSVGIGLAIVSNDGIQVTATVPATPGDFAAQLTVNKSASDYIREDTTLEYRLVYGSQLSNNTSIVVEAQWDLGTIQGNATPTENILEYVVGSASNAYGNAPPVIDSVNRKITWSISNFPANTSGQYVTFNLKTNDDSRGSTPVTLTVNGRVLGPGTQSADSTTTNLYLYSQYITPTQGPTSTPSPNTSTPTPTTPVSLRPIIYAIDIRTITATQASIFVAANKDIRARISYGTTQSSLSQSVRSDDLSTLHLLDLQNLKPNTRYFFRVVITDVDGDTASSDLYVLDTASISKQPRLLTNSILITSGDVLLTGSLPQNGTSPNIIIPFDTEFSFRFGVEPFQDVKSMNAILRSNDVLGATTAHANSTSLPLTEISPGQFIGKLTSTSSPGIYRLILQIQDYNGNISEQTGAMIYVVNPLKITDAFTKNGVENVKVIFYYFNDRLKTYNLLSSSLTSIKNPTKSRAGGIVDAILPEGKYKMEFEVLGYRTKSVDFEIGPNASNYPTVDLEPLPFNIITHIKYFINTIGDIYVSFTEFIHSIRLSNRFFDVIAFFAISLFVLTSTLTLSKKLAVPIVSLPYFFVYHLIGIFRKPNHTFVLHGIVKSDTGSISKLPIYFSSLKGKVINHIRTNSDGEFMVTIHDKSDIKISTGKKGYSNYSTVIKKEDLNKKVEIDLVQQKKPSTFSLQTIRWYYSFIASSIFETVLFATLILELIFSVEFGLARTLPFIMVSLLNLFLWAAHSRN